MRTPLPWTILCVTCVAALAVTLAGPVAPTRAGGEDKVLSVGKDGLKVEGKVEANDPKVKISVGQKSGELPAKLFLVKLAGGKRYRMAMDSGDIDSVLVVQNKA